MKAITRTRGPYGARFGCAIGIKHRLKLLSFRLQVSFCLALMGFLASEAGLAGDSQATLRGNSQTTAGQLEVVQSPDYGLPQVSLVRTVDDESRVETGHMQDAQRVRREMESPVPVWSLERPDSSRAYLRINNRVFELRRNLPSVRAEVLDKEETFAQEWAAGGFRATLTIEAAHSLGEYVVDTDSPAVGLRMTMRLENEGQRSAEVGLRYLFDTWFGEESDAHFRAGQADEHGAVNDEHGAVNDEHGAVNDEPVSSERITAERSFDPDHYRYVESSGSSGALRLLLAPVAGARSGISEVAVANRRRLSETAWSYNTGRGRGFSVRPFSLNDSALHVLFNPISIAPGESRQYVLYFLMAPERSDFEDVRPRDEPVAAPTAPERDAEVPRTPEHPDRQERRREAIEELNDTLQRLREISEGERSARPGELEEIRETIERLRDLRDRL